MSDQFLGEIRLFGFATVPNGWYACDGQFLQINLNQALFSLLGTTFGGNGTTNFALPDLRGRCPVHVGQGLSLGQSMGEEAHVLTIPEMPTHVHYISAATADGDNPNVIANRLAAFNNGYRAASNPVALSPSSVTSTGSGQAHENMQPFLTMTYGIAHQGIFPSRN